MNKPIQIPMDGVSNNTQYYILLIDGYFQFFKTLTEAESVKAMTKKQPHVENLKLMGHLVAQVMGIFSNRLKKHI